MKKKELQAVIRSSYVDFKGGLDQLTPSWKAAPGTLRAAENYEIGIEGGYEDIQGYERFDGQSAPSDAQYATLPVTITGSFSADDTITGVTSSATAVVLAVVTDVGDDDYLVVAKITGTFETGGETLNVSGSPEGSSTEGTTIDGASTKKLHAQYNNLAADEYRGDILAVPGTGSVLGVWSVNDVKFAFRNHTSWGSVKLTGGASGSVDGITVNSVEIMSGAEAFDTDLATTASNVAANINANTSSPNYTANAVGALIRIRALAENSFTVTSSTTTITTTDTNMSGHGSGAELYKSSASGWTLVAFGFELSFTSGGTYEILEGDTITGNTSGATAVITRVVKESGTWAGGDAAGRLIFDSQTGTFQSENLKVGASTNVATIAGDSDAITFLPDGRFEFVNNNFGGSSGQERAYGCDGVNRGFEFYAANEVFVPIETGMTTDTPTHINAHKNHLFFSFTGSAQHSGIGTPYIWSPVSGASEIATGDTITAFMVEPGGEGNSALGIYNTNRIHILYGNSSSDWNLVRYRQEIGAFAYSIQQLHNTVFFGDRGISDLRTVQAFGNFQYATYSRPIQDLINTKKTLTAGSCIVRDKNQYRLFFTDGTGLYVTLGAEEGGVMGMIPVSFTNPVTCVFSLEKNDGSEEMFFGSDNGFVYQMDKGTSFDGENILAFFTTQFDYAKALRIIKKYRDLALEAKGSGYAEFSLNYEISYASTLRSQPSPSTIEVDLLGSSVWDTGSWDSGFWDGQSLKPATHKLSTSGENISFTVQKDSDYMTPLRFSGIFYWYSPRRRLRN